MLLGLNFAASLTSTALLSRNPELLAERSNVKAGKSWDKPLVGFMVLVGPVATWITAGLDTRFHWSDAMPTSGFLAGLAVAVLSAALIAWAMHSTSSFLGGPHPEGPRTRRRRKRSLSFRATPRLHRHGGVHSRHPIDPQLAMGSRARRRNGGGSRSPNGLGRSHPSQRARGLRRLREQGEIQALTAYLVSPNTADTRIHAVSLNGLNTRSPGRRKSRSLPVAIVSPCFRAVAAI